MENDPEFLYERVRHLTNLAIWSIDLQKNRIANSEPEDERFQFRRWADYHFLIVALSRLRQTVEQLQTVEIFRKEVEISLARFDIHFPWLRDLRNVVAHFDEYPIGKGNNKSIRRESTEVAMVSTEKLQWLDFEIQPEIAVREASTLFDSVKKCRNLLEKNTPNK